MRLNDFCMFRDYAQHCIDVGSKENAFKLQGVPSYVVFWSHTTYSYV